MAIIRTKDNIPQHYVAESRDFQLFTRILDVTQNATKFNIDSILNIIDTSTIPACYIDRLKSKLGFFTPHYYDTDTLRNILLSFPSIMKHKGSEIGIEKCVNVFLNTIGIEKGSKIDIYNEHDIYPYTIRIGVNTEISNTLALKDMLSYIIPTGYFVEIYYYENTKSPALHTELNTKKYVLPVADDEKSIVRYNPFPDEMKNSTFNTVQLSTVYDPYEKESQVQEDE